MRDELLSLLQPLILEVEQFNKVIEQRGQLEQEKVPQENIDYQIQVILLVSFVRRLQRWLRLRIYWRKRRKDVDAEFCRNIISNHDHYEKVLTIQRVVRGYLVRRRGLLASKKYIREYKINRARWKQRSERLAPMRSDDITLVQKYLISQTQMKSIENLISTDKERFQEQWQQYTEEQEKISGERKLSDDWVIQTDKFDNRVFLNIATGVKYKENPITLRLQTHLQKQSKIAQGMFKQRMNELEQTLTICKEQQEQLQNACLAHFEHYLGKEEYKKFF
jgi:hypothetical protein